MDSSTFATVAPVVLGNITIEGYLLPVHLQSPTNKFGVSKTQAIILAYPDYDRKQAAKKYIRLMATRTAERLAPQGIELHPLVPVSQSTRGNPNVDLLPADKIVLFLKIAKKLGSKASDEMIDDLAGLSIQQLFSDAFAINFTIQDRQNALLNWQQAREVVKYAHDGMCESAKRKGHPGHLVHDYMTTLIFGDTAKAARMKALVDPDSDVTIGLNHQEDAEGLRTLAKVKRKYARKRKGTWQEQVESAVREVLAGK